MEWFQAQKRVGKGHACDAGRVVHFFARKRVLRTVIKRTRQKIEHDIHSLQRKSVGEIACHGGNIRFQRVCEHVHARVARDGFRHAHDKLGVDDGHVGTKRVSRPADILYCRFCGR